MTDEGRREGRNESLHWCWCHEELTSQEGSRPPAGTMHRPAHGRQAQQVSHPEPGFTRTVFSPAFPQDPPCLLEKQPSGVKGELGSPDNTMALAPHRVAAAAQTSAPLTKPLEREEASGISGPALQVRKCRPTSESHSSVSAGEGLYEITHFFF